MHACLIIILSENIGHKTIDVPGMPNAPEPFYRTTKASLKIMLSVRVLGTARDVPAARPSKSLDQLTAPGLILVVHLPIDELPVFRFEAQ
ncbi:hypothetical protein NQ317_006270 [Molorchus minor]|uniref:Cytochrome P450 n=1 Tax=Molorchus minor TaxID=1323400 RepID=A0ABQ9IWZ8_9CUCU|nr:hypothetical protein NQ317_006270 [Molorchus minor]